MSVSFISLVNRAKANGCYGLANAAMACLAHRALDDEERYSLYWETEYPECEDDDEIDYYDLLVIGDGGQETACIPAPLLLARNQKAWRYVSKKVDRMSHERVVSLELTADEVKGNLKQIQTELEELEPNWRRWVNKYLQDSVDLESNFLLKRLSQVELAEVERENKRVAISLRDDGKTFTDLDWESGEYWLHHNGDGSYSIQEGEVYWAWYYVSRKLPTLEPGKARFLIGKGCDHSSSYEVWTFNDPSETEVETIQNEIAPDSAWIPLVLDEYGVDDASSGHYSYTHHPEAFAKWGRKYVVKFSDLCLTADFVFDLRKMEPTGVPFQDSRILVWNRLAQRHDVLHEGSAE